MLGWRVLPGIDLGGLRISPHGLFIAIGVLVGAILTVRRAKRRGYPEERVWTVIEIAVLASIVGARVGYIAGHYEQFSSPVEWLKIWQGGLSLIGSLIGAFLAAALYIRHKGYDFFELADFAAPGLGLGIAVGRIGDLIIGDHLGRETSGFWGWQYKGGELISPPPCTYSTSTGCITPADAGIVVHQTALYDMLWSLAILGLLTLIERRPQRRGVLFLSWGLLYAAGRIATDFARVEKRWLGLGLTGSQLASVAGVLVALYGMTRLKHSPVSAGAAAATYALESEEAAEVEGEIGAPEDSWSEVVPEPPAPWGEPVVISEEPAGERVGEPPGESVGEPPGESVGDTGEVETPRDPTEVSQQTASDRWSTPDASGEPIYVPGHDQKALDLGVGPESPSRPPDLDETMETRPPSEENEEGRG